MRFILAILFVSEALSRPAEEIEKNSFFSASNKKSKLQSADEKYEMISHEVLETNQNYELRRYPAAKWVCTKENDVDPLADPMRDWETKYDNNPMQAMTGKDWKDSTTSEMFMRLFRYIVGVNQDAIEIEMTRPVPIKVTPVKTSPKIDYEMCFWLGTPYESQEAPQPIDKKVTIVEKPPMVVYVRQFNGYPHSYQNWEVEYKNLKKDLLGDSSDNDNINADLDVWYHIGYDSPWIPADQRRNEIWIPYIESVETNTIY